MLIFRSLQIPTFYVYRFSLYSRIYRNEQAIIECLNSRFYCKDIVGGAMDRNIQNPSFIHYNHNIFLKIQDLKY